MQRTACACGGSLRTLAGRRRLSTRARRSMRTASAATTPCMSSWLQYPSFCHAHSRHLSCCRVLETRKSSEEWPVFKARCAFLPIPCRLALLIKVDGFVVPMVLRSEMPVRVRLATGATLGKIVDTAEFAPPAHEVSLVMVCWRLLRRSPCLSCPYLRFAHSCR